eukprot:scaffold11575_cov66-Attheya_sp.AAC.1
MGTGHYRGPGGAPGGVAQTLQHSAEQWKARDHEEWHSGVPRDHKSNKKKHPMRGPNPRDHATKSWARFQLTELTRFLHMLLNIFYKSWIPWTCGEHFN